LRTSWKIAHQFIRVNRVSENMFCIMYILF
jgi:hypothetical protein